MGCVYAKVVCRCCGKSLQTRPARQDCLYCVPISCSGLGLDTTCTTTGDPCFISCVYVVGVFDNTAFLPQLDHYDKNMISPYRATYDPTRSGVLHPSSDWREHVARSSIQGPGRGPVRVGATGGRVGDKVHGAREEVLCRSHQQNNTIYW